MQAPGEKLIERLWETIAEKGIGSLLRPWQMRREAKASADARRHELLLLAQTERDVAAIRNGEVRLLPDGSLQRLAHVRESDAEEYALLRGSATKRLASAVTADAVRREVNVAKAVLHSEAELENDAQQPPAAVPNSDWLYRWRDAAGEVAAEELQHLWGRLLAGEIKSPGLYSLRTLEFFRNVSTAEALEIDRLSQLVIETFVYRDPKTFELGDIDFDFMLRMQELGLVAGVEAPGLTFEISSRSSESFRALLRARLRGLLVSHPDATRLELPAYPITRIGREVLSVGAYEPNAEYLRFVGRSICSRGFDVALVRYEPVDEKTVRYHDTETLCTQTAAGVAL